MIEASTGSTVVERLERQIERGSLFTHTALGRQFIRLHETESFAYGLADLLLSKNMVSAEELQAAVERVRREQGERGELSGPGVALRVDPPESAEQPMVAVDCAARMHVCHSICCKLDFALSAEEVEAGHVKWDLGRPYFIRHEADGFCTHNDRASGNCSVYGNRPAVCRGYSCANDTRIWKDFATMELNREWLAEHLVTTRPQLVAALMQQIESGPATPGVADAEEA